MAKKINNVLAIDIGGASLKMAEFSFPPSGGMMLENFAFYNMDDRETDPVAAFAEAYTRLMSENKFSAKDVCLSVSGQSSFCRLAKLPQLGSNKSAVSRIIGFEAQQIVPYPMDEVIWGYQLISHTEKKEVVEPAAEEGGEPTVKVEENEVFEALFMAVKNDQISAYTDIIVDSGKRIASVDIAPVAMFNAAVSTQCSDGECTLLLNIGGRSTSLVISDGSRIFVRNIPIAGDTITQQVSKEMGIGFREAEELKIRHGFVALGGAYDEPESELAAAISKISRNVMTRLHGEVTRSVNVWRSQHGGNRPVRVLLAGGGSTMYYTKEFFQEKLRCNVDFLNVFPAVTLSGSIDREKLLDVASSFPELIGACLHCLGTCPVDISLIPKSIQFQDDFRRKAPYFYISAALVLICLGFFFVAERSRSAQSQSMVDGARDKVEATVRMQSRIKKLMGDNAAVKSSYKELASIVDQRFIWADMIMELQSMLPAHMWIASLEGVGEMAVPQNNSRQEDMGGGFDFAPAGSRRTETVAAQQVNLNTRVDASALVNVNALRVKLYSIVFDNSLHEEELRESLKKSKYFSDADDGFKIIAYESGKGVDNLKSFTVEIKLKNPIKK